MQAPPPLLISSINKMNTQIFGQLVVKGDSIVNGNIKNVQDPVNSTDILNKQTAESIVVNSISWKINTKAATTSNITLSGEQTVDGISLSTGDRILVKNQISGVDNGIYDVGVGVWSRSSDLANGSNAASIALWVDQGTVNADSAFICTNDSGSDIVGTDILTFVLFSTTGSLTAGTGLDITTSTLSVTSSVIRTTGGQTITGNLNLTGTLDSGTFTDSTITITGGNITGLLDMTVTDKVFSTGVNQLGNTDVTVDGTTGNIPTQGDITLYNSSQNMIVFRDVGFADPSTTARSDGTKIDLNTTALTSSTQLMYGINTGVFWYNSTGKISFGTIPLSSSTISFSGEEMGGGNFTTSTFTRPTLDGPQIGGLEVEISANGRLNLRKVNVTQITSITTAVSVATTPSGRITTVTATTAAGSSDSFNVTTTTVSDANVFVTLADYSGTFFTNGVPIIYVTDLVSNSFTITITNIHATNALNGTLDIYFCVL